jgi:hypothetical protein
LVEVVEGLGTSAGGDEPRLDANQVRDVGFDITDQGLDSGDKAQSVATGERGGSVGSLNSIVGCSHNSIRGGLDGGDIGAERLDGRVKTRDSVNDNRDGASHGSEVALLNDWVGDGADGQAEGEHSGGELHFEGGGFVTRQVSFCRAKRTRRRQRVLSE